MGGLIGSDPQRMMMSDPRSGRRPTGGSSKAAQYKDSEKSGLGFGNDMAFKTPQQISKEKKLSYERASSDGSTSGMAGYQRMTGDEREKYRVENMQVAATKKDDYSDWGKGVKKAADTAHSKGLLSQEDKIDQRIIDARDWSKYDYDVIRPEQERKGEILKQKNLFAKQMKQFTYGDKQYGGASIDPQLPGSGTGGFRGGGGSKWKSSSANNRSGGGSGWSSIPRPWSSSTSAVQAYQLGKDGWTPGQIKTATTGINVGKARATQAGLSGVYLG